jgi:hypothetical protein
MFQINPSATPQAQSCVFFAYNGRSLMKLPILPDEAITLIHNTGDALWFMRFSLADAERITAALTAGATFCFSEGTLRMESPSARLEFTPLPPDDETAPPPALPSPREIYRLHTNQPRPDSDE